MSDDTQPASRAGRNLPAAVASGVVLVALVLITLFTVEWLFVVLVTVALLIAVREFELAFAARGILLSRTPLYAATAVIPVVAYVWGMPAQLAAMGAAILAMLFWRIRRGIDGFVSGLTATVFVAAYLPLMAGFLMLTLAADNGPQRVIVFILLTIGNDIGGYAAGVLFGKHPIAPQISPKKSWEGFVGSLVMQALLGAGGFVWLLDAPWWQGVIAGVILTFTATAGDFVESAIKRDLGLKDMGHLLPGHGGMMDRLDSLIPNAFASWAIFTIFLGSS